MGGNRTISEPASWRIFWVVLVSLIL